MQAASADVHLIANSHGVALLDALTYWRKSGACGGEQDARYGAAFKGWFDGSIGGAPFETEIVDHSFRGRSLHAWVLSSGTPIGPLARLRQEDGQIKLYLAERFSQTLQAWDNGRPIVSMLAGNEHALTMLNNLPEYDFIEPEVPGVQPGAQIIDDLFIDERISQWVEPVLSAICGMRRVTRCPVIHVLPPPPREDPMASQHLEGIGDFVRQFGLVSDRLRLKWYRRYCRRVTEVLQPLGCEVLPAPAEACTADGLLRQELAEGLTHGNRGYGALVARQLSPLM